MNFICVNQRNPPQSDKFSEREYNELHLRESAKSARENIVHLISETLRNPPTADEKHNTVNHHQIFILKDIVGFDVNLLKKK